MSPVLWIILGVLAAVVVFAAGFMTGVRQATRNWLGLRVEAWWLAEHAPWLPPGIRLVAYRRRKSAERARSSRTGGVPS